MHLIPGIDVPVHYQRVTSLVSAYLGIGQRHISAVLILPHFLRTVIKVSTEFLGTFSRIYPPLPGRQDILDIDVGPFLVAAHFTVDIILHAFTDAEIRIEYRAVNHRTLSHEIRHARPAACITHFHIRTRIAGLIPCIGRITFHAREKHTFSLRDHPLVICILKLRAVQPSLVMIRRGKQRHAGLQVLGAVLIGIQPFNIACRTMTAAESTLVIFHPIENLLVRVVTIVRYPLQLGVNTSRPTIIYKYGILNLLKLTITVNIILQPFGFGGIHGAVGIIILCPESCIRQTGQELLLSVAVLGVNSLLRVKEIPVIAKVFRHLNQLFRHRECPILIHGKQLVDRLPRTVILVEIQAGNRLDSVSVGSIGIGRIRDVQYAELKIALFPPPVCLRVILIVPVMKIHRRVLRGRTMPG